MSGFQIFLCVIAGIIAFFIILLSIPVHVSFTYNDKINLSIRILFIKLNLLPIDPNKKKKPKKEKPKKEEEEKPEEEKEEKPKEKKPNPIIAMVKANGYDGMMIVITNLGHVLGIYGGKIFKSIVFNEITYYSCIGTGDAASTAIEYGKTCRKVYPILGFICNNNLVKRYDVLIEPDFLANSSEGEFSFDFHLVIRKIINATVAMLVRLVFKVVLKFLKGAKNKTPSPKADTNENTAQKAEETNK